MANEKSECQELKNIQYKTMLLNGTPNEQNKNTHININIDNLDSILDKDQERSVKEPWSKLDKTLKIKKLKEYTEKLSKEKNLSNAEKQQLNQYLLNALSRKRLQRVKDVNYDKQTGEIRSIPCLIFNKSSHNFTLKRSEKRQSTLKALGPGKTRKKKEKIDADIKDKIS